MLDTTRAESCAGPSVTTPALDEEESNYHDVLGQSSGNMCVGEV